MGKRRFIAEVWGESQTNASRLGNERSGIRSHTRGWNLGIKVHGDVRSDSGLDQFIVEVTGGSHNPSATRRVFTVKETEEGTIRIEYNGEAYEVLDKSIRPLVVGIH